MSNEQDNKPDRTACKDPFCNKECCRNNTQKSYDRIMFHRWMKGKKEMTHKSYWFGPL